MAGNLEFNPKARIIRTIGDQLISGPEAAVIELVKNAYDADASFVRVQFVPPVTKGQGRINVIDDGHGMSLGDIKSKWMEPATPDKKRSRSSPGGRRFLGSKGIGRFSAAKLGSKMGLRSIAVDGTSRKEVIIPEIDWEVFSEDIYLNDIRIEFYEQDTDEATGTELEILELSEDWTRTKIKQLHLELKRLIAPLGIQGAIQNVGDQKEFKIYLDLSRCTNETAGFDGSHLINGGVVLDDDQDSFLVTAAPLLDTCDYEIEGKFDEMGSFSGTMAIHRGQQEPRSLELQVPMQDGESSCGTVQVHFYIFDREASALKATMGRAGLGDLTAAKSRQILDEISGVAIYRAGFRIRPYGDPENDWLTLDKLRVQKPTHKIGHNQISGYVVVEGEGKSGLVERSSREGFEQNGSYRRLHGLVVELLAGGVEPRRYGFREAAGISRSKATSFSILQQGAQLRWVEQLIDDLPNKNIEMNLYCSA